MAKSGILTKAQEAEKDRQRKTRKNQKLHKKVNEKRRKERRDRYLERNGLPSDYVFPSERQKANTQTGDASHATIEEPIDQDEGMSDAAEATDPKSPTDGPDNQQDWLSHLPERSKRTSEPEVSSQAKDTVDSCLEGIRELQR